MARKVRIPIVPVLVAVLLLLTVLLLYPIFEPGRETVHRSSPITLLKQQALAIAMYSSDFDGRMPPAESWMDAIYDYCKNDLIFRDSSVEDLSDNEFGFAFFEPLSLIDASVIANPETVPLTFQSSDLSRNASGLLDLLPGRTTKGTNCVSFADSHAKTMPKGWPHGPITIVLKEGADAEE